MLRDELAAIGAPIGVTVLTPGGVRTPPILGALARARADEHADPVMLEFLETRVAAAVEPIEVGRLTVRAVLAGALYVNTHRETLDWLQATRQPDDRRRRHPRHAPIAHARRTTTSPRPSWGRSPCRR